jgi:putative ABC transport system permease protein
MNEIRFALRRLLKNPLQLAAGILAFTLGIGVNTAMYSLAHALLFKPVELANLTSLVTFQSFQKGVDRGLTDIAPADFRDMQSSVGSLSEIGFAAVRQVNLNREFEPEQVIAAEVSSNWLSLLGSRMLLGRNFDTRESTPGANRVVIITEGLWTRRYGRTPSIIGQQITINRESYNVVGVIADTARFPAYAQLLTPQPLTTDYFSSRTAFDLLVVGRMAPGQSLATVQGEMTAFFSRLARQYPDSHNGRTVEVVTLQSRVGGGNHMLESYMRMLLFATSFALLIACANVANLQLARVSARAREFAILSALGAGRWAVARQAMWESLILSLGGALLGSLASIWSVDWIKRLVPTDVWIHIPMWPHMSVNQDAVIYTTFIAISAGLISGIAPAFNSSRHQAQEALREGGRSSSRGAARQRFRAVLVSAQMALALLLLIGAGLMVRSADTTLHRADNKQPDQIATFSMQLPDNEYATREQRIDLIRRLEEGLRAIPGSQGAALTNYLPLSDNYSTVGYSIEGRAAQPVADLPRAFDQIVNPSYFDLNRIRLRAGRLLEAGDTSQREPVCVIDETLAAQTFPNENPLGHRIVYQYRQSKPVCRVVGVVTADLIDIWANGPAPTLYRPMAQSAPYMVAVMMRSAGEPAASLAAARQVVAAIDPNLPMAGRLDFRELIHQKLVGIKLVAVFMAAIGTVALVLACLGIFAVMSYVVTERTGEIGMRVAMGASPRDIAILLGRQGLWMCGSGMAIGLMLGYFAAQALRNLIVGITPSDFWSLASVSLLLGAIAAIAMYLPARRAIRMDPSTALRHD